MSLNKIKIARIVKRVFAAILLVLTMLSLIGFTYYLDITDENSNLNEAFRSALDAWTLLDETIVSENLDDSASAEAIIRLGQAALFGPDTLSITSQQQDEKRQNIILINPEQSQNQRVLRHEVGLLLGLTPSDTGIMKAAVSKDEGFELSEENVQSLKAVVNAAKEDINRDGKVDYYDLVALAQAFGQSDFNSPADLTKDGLVDNADLEVLRAAYTFSSPAQTDPNQAANPDPNNPDAIDPNTLDPTNPESSTLETLPERTLNDGKGPF